MEIQKTWTDIYVHIIFVPLINDLSLQKAYFCGRDLIIFLSKLGRFNETEKVKMTSSLSIFFAAFGMLTAVLGTAALDVEKPTALVFRSPFSEFVGGVYAMTNDFDQNSILAYARRPNGTIMFLDSFRTGGKGGDLGNGNGVDPLVSAFSVIMTPDYRFLFAVNAGSNSISVFKVLSNFKLRLMSTRKVAGFGPVSIAYSRNILYVASADADGKFESLNDQRGVLSGFKLTKFGFLIPLFKSSRALSSRPSAIQFSPDGQSLLVSFVNTGSAALNTTEVEEIATYAVFPTGQLSASPIDTATSTIFNNEDRRNLPSAIGFETVRVEKAQYVVVTEARALSFDGNVAPSQTSSVSTWRLTDKHKLVPVQLDVFVGTSVTSGQRASCWIEFSKSMSRFWVANTASGTLSSFSFEAGRSTLVSEEEATVPVPIDLWRSVDGKFLYQLYNGNIAVFEIQERGRGAGLRRIQTVDNLPDQDVQGIVAF